MPNNRKPNNKRGKLSRGHFKQYAPEAPFIKVDGELVANHNYPGTRTIIHYPQPKVYDGLWGLGGE